jgi:hypothetical protein
MDTLLSIALGGLIGSLLSTIVTYSLFRSQVRIDSNRKFLQEMIETIQRIFLSISQNIIVEDGEINYLISFQAFGLKEFTGLNEKLLEIENAIHSYNEGVLKTTQMTTTSSLQMTSKKEVEKKINELIKIIRKLT